MFIKLSFLLVYLQLSLNKVFGNTVYLCCKTFFAAVERPLQYLFGLDQLALIDIEAPQVIIYFLYYSHL